MLKILITGGAGSLGQELVKHFYNQGYEVTALFRTPQKQYALKQKYPNLKIILTDICNSDAIRQACRGQDILIHAAALKQIDVGEYHPEEFTRVNAWGVKWWLKRGMKLDRSALLSWYQRTRLVVR